MLVVETVAKIRRAYFVQGKAIKAICRELRVSRKAVRKVLRSKATEFRYHRDQQPLRRIGPCQDELDRLLAANETKPSRERLTLVRIFEELRALGYEGGYDAVRRYARAWQDDQARVSHAYVPLSFAPGEAYQFDWSHEVVLINGTTVTVKVAHVRLCHSRMLFVRAYPRETQEMVFDAHARAHRHPEQREQTVWQVFEAERPSLVRYAGRFDGFHAVPASVSKTCLVRFDHNRYSVAASAVGRPVEIRAYADRIELRQDGHVVGEHRRCFGRDQTVFDPWHYVPVLLRKPGALRNGAPFKDWVLPAGLERIRRKLAGSADGDRQMVAILAAVLSGGLAAVEAACLEALSEGVHSADVVLNILARRREPKAAPITVTTPDALRLRHAPAADCARYDSLRRTL
jgi:transposase